MNCPNCTLPLSANFLEITSDFGFCNACRTILKMDDDTIKVATFEEIEKASERLGEEISPDNRDVFCRLIEANAVSITRNWHKHADFLKTGQYENINLGELIEHKIFSEILKVMKSEFYD
ncbi:hypothetical protein IT568_08685 [bacterium]|nr:hypothetical protein [bacterium]